MVQSTVGILLNNIKHSDSSAVLQIFTREFGRKAYFIRGLTKKKNSPRSLLFPMSILELQVTDRENKTIQQIRDVNIHKPTFELMADPVKASVAMFLNEILHKSIEKNYQNDMLYDFLENAIQILDVTSEVKNFHLWFLLELSKYFGFYPMKSSVASPKNKQFDLESGTFVSDPVFSSPYLDCNTSELLWSILGMNFDEMCGLKMHPEARKKLLNGLVDYFIVHVPNLKSVASLDVLETVVDFKQ